MSTQLNLDNNNPLSGVASSAKPDERYLVMLNGEAQIWDADRYNRNAQQLYADHAEDALAFKLDDGGGDLKAVLRQQLSAMEGVKDRYREAITGAQTYKDLLSIPGLAESQYLVTLGDEQQVWDAARLQRNGDRLMSDHPEAQISQLSYKDYWYDKALADEESIKASKAEIDALKAEFAKQQRWSPEANALESQIIERQSALDALQAGYDANPRVVEAKAKYDAEYAAALEEYKQNYLPNLRSQIIQWQNEDVDMLAASKGAARKKLSGSPMMAGDPMGVMQAIDMLKGEDPATAFEANTMNEQYQSAQAFLAKAERLRESHSSFGEGVANVAMNQLEAWGSQSDMEAYSEIYGILKRLEDKLGNLDDISEEELTQNLSKSEQALILAFFEYNAAQADVQGSTGWAYKAGQIAGEAVPFILEFIATGGLTKAATKGATKGLSKALTSWIKNATKGSFRRTARKVVAKGVRGAAQGLTQAAMITPLRPTAYTNVTKAMTQIGKDGKLKDSGSDIAIAIADEYIETLSELSGGAITSVLGGLAKGTAKKFLSKNMYDTFATWGKRLANASGVKLLKSAQFHGLPVEIAEEYLGNTLRELYDAKALDKMHEDGNFAAMLLGFAPLTVLGAGVGMGQYVNAKNKVNKGAARLAGILAKDGFDKDQIDALIALEKELSPYSLAEKLDPVLTSMTKAGASKESRDAVIKYAMDVVRFKTLEGTVNAQESKKRQEKLDELTGKLGTFYQTKNEGTKWQENTVTQATLYDGRTVFLTSAKNEMGEFAAVDAETGETLPVSESDIAMVENAETGESSLAVESQSLDTYLTSLVMSERKTAEEMRMADERATQIAALQERLKADAKLNIGTSDAPIYLAYLPEQSNDDMAHFTMPDGSETILKWEQVGDYLNQPIRVFTDAQLADAEAAELENEEARLRAENAETNEDMDKVEEAVEDAEELEEEANPVHIPMNPDGTVNTDLFWDQNPEEWVKWNDQQRQDNGVDSMAQIAAGLQTAEAKLAEASKLPFATPTQREARDKEMGFWQDKINRYNALLEQYQLAAAAQEAQMARAYAAERLEAAEAALADKMKQAPKRSDYRFTPQYMQAKQKYDAEVAALQEEVTRWQNELAQYGEMPVQQEEVVPEENVPVAEEQPEEVAPTAEELAAQLDAMLMSGASRSDEAVVAAMQAYADAIASGAPAKVVTRKNVMQVLKDAGVSETKMAEVRDALRRIQYIVNGFEANGVAYMLADGVITSEHLRGTYVHERQHIMTAVSGIDAALMTMTSREELQDAIQKLTGSSFYGGKSHKVLADELISMAMERAYKGENLDEVFEQIGFKNENAINFIKDIDNAQRNDSGLSLARVAGIGGNAAEGGSRQDGRTALSGSTEMGEQGSRSVGRGGETAGDNTSGRGVGFSVSPNEGVAAMIENENGDAIAETNGGGDVRFSVLTYEQGGRDYLVNWLRKSKYMSKEERDFIIATLDQQYELAKRLGEEFPAFGAWSSAEVNVDKDGNPVMSVIKANGDYSMNLDFSLICKKRRPLNALLDVMIADRMLDMRSLNEAEIAKINKVIQRHGFEVACALCFVDSKRYRVVKVATDFADLYNELVNSLIPEGSGIEAVESNYAGYEYINERNAEKTGRRLETVPDAELNWAKVDEILEGVKTPKSVEEKVAWMLRNNPSQRKLVNATDFVTNLGFESVKKNNPELLKIYNAKKGTGGPKASFGDVQYLNDILKSRSFTPAKAYSVGGVRVQSFSDYMGHMFFDYMQMMAELSAKGLPAHAYTKEEAFARIFGMTGMKINMSLVPAVADDGVAPGLDAQGNYVWAVPYTDENGNEIQGQTFPPEVAFELQRDPRYSKNVGIIAVGVSDEHILKMLNDDEIHFIIPYHKSSLNPEVAKMTKIDKYADYTNVQNTRLGWEYANLDKEQKKAELKKRAFDFYKSLAKTKDPKATAAEYLEHCRQNGLIPKYDQFSGHENYYKLLVDFNTYDFNTGEYAPQGPVTMTFPEELESLVKASVASNEELESDLKDKVGKMAEDVKAELGGTRFSARTDEQREKLFADAKAEFGLTNNFNVAGYMLPDGSLLNFGDPANPTTRAEDHRAIEGVIMENGTEYDSRWMYLADFMNEGAIRLLPEYAGINLMKAPTMEQRQRLFDFIYKYNGEVILEIADERLNNVAYVEYDRRTSPSRIFRDIDGYFNEGIVPQQDTRFSASNNNQEIFVSNAAKAVEGIKMEKATPAQWLAMLEKNGGLKAAEDKWMGLSDWLKESDKKTLTKAEVLDFINEHMIVIEEQHYGEVSEENINANTEKYLTEKYGEQFAQMFFGNAFSVEDDMHSVWRLSIWDDYNAAKLYNEANGTNIEVGEDGLGEDASEKIIAWGEGVLKEADNSLKTRPIHSTRRNYTTDGLENLHEIALSVPTIEPWNESDDIHFGDAGDGRAVAWIRFGETEITEEGSLMEYEPKNNVEREIKDYIEMGMNRWGYPFEECVGYAYNQITDAPQESVGWTEEAVTAVAEGMRRKARRRKVLVIDEIQSKRHQEGRENGYRVHITQADRDAAGKALEIADQKWEDFTGRMKQRYGGRFANLWEIESYDFIERSELEEGAQIRDEFADALAITDGLDTGNDNLVPDAPFEKNWHELAMKRMLRYAAENGYDYIAWTKGAQQAERYNIGNYVSSIDMQEEYDGNRDFGFYMGDSDEALTITVDENGTIVSAEDHLSQAEGRPLADLVGKEMADKMMQMEEYDVLEDTDLNIGNKGMEGFYDKMLPAFMNKYGKKWGIKVADITLPEVEEAGRVMHSVPVTEEMKASVMEGQVMFSIGNNPQTDAMNAKQLKVPGGMLTDEQMGVADIRFSITKNNRATIEKWLRMRKDLNPAEKRAFWMYIEDKAPAMQMAIGRWFAKGAIRLPEDLTAVEDAFKFAQKMRVNAMDYETPAAIIKDYADRFGKGKEKDKEKRELLSPDDERFNGILTNKVDYGNGIVVYDVQNDMVGQKAVRELINDHLGTDVNIWCLLYANAEGEPTEGAEKMWWHYNSTQKKVMFYNGEIAAFCASDKKDSEWWDLHDKSHGTRIPVQLPVEGDRLGRSSICEFDGKKILPPAKGERYFRGNKKKGRYEEWANKNASSIVLRTIRKGGKDDGLMEEWDGKGNLIYKGNYKASEAIGHHVHYASNGQVIKDVTYDQNGKEDGFSRLYEEDGNPIYVRQYVHGRPEGEWLEYENGKLKSTFTYENGILTGYQIEYDKKGKVVSQKYHNTYKDGNYTMTVTHENGPEGKIVGVKRRLKHDSPVIESLEIEERPGGWFKKPETTIYMRKGGTSIWYSDKEGLLSYYSYDQKSNERRSIGMSSEGIQVSFWPSNAVFNRKGRLLSFDGMTDSKSLAENRKEADRMWAFASDIMANAKDMAEGMENEILTKVQESEVRFSVVPHESSMDEVDSMFKQYNGDPFVRELYGKVSELAHTMGLKISFAEGMGRRSGLNALDKIKYNVDYFNSPGVYSQDKAKTLLHELIHAVTRYAIYAKDAEFMNPRLKEAVSQLESIYDEIKNDPAFEDMYGATSVEEMVSELANVRFRAKLREKNLLQRIVDAIKDLLGIDKGTKALDNLSATLEDMIVNFDRAAYEQVRKDVSMQENYMRFSVDPAVSSEEGTRFSVVTDPMLVAKFESEPKIKVYRAMQLIDGKLYPPMSAKIDGKMREPIELGMWEQAEERPDLVDEKGNFKLDKGNKTSLKARYNPYFHTSTTPLNDQFSSAQSRPELVTVEVEVPASELTSGYKAENAKDAVGKVEWKAGVVQGKLSGTREVILSRWDKPIRIVPDSEVAAEIVKMFDGKDIIMHSNVVTPSLRAELEKLGVPFVETTNNGKLLTDIASMETPVWESKGTFENLAAAEEWADKNLKGKSEVNKFTGERISIGNKSVSKMLSEKSQNQSVSIPVHLAALQSVLDFIRTGIPAETHRDKQGRDFDVLRLYNAFEFDGHLYRVKSTVRKVKQGDKYYTYEVQEMELIEERQANWKGEGNNPRNPDSSINSITGAKLLKGVKKSNSNELILQESAEVPFSVSERPVDEIVNDGVQKVSEEGKKAKASLKQRMDDIDSKLYYVMRLVANAQKNYDKKTVDIMTNLAKELMRDGALSDPTRGEINRLLSAIKNATGKADLTAAATTLMDVMVSNQLRHAKNTLAQMLKIKAKKVNASGVEVQGTLDLVGQRLIATVKESVGLTLEKIDERIADAKEKMDSEFETIKNNAAIDLVGLNIARKYVEGIVASEAEEKDLRKELESAQEDKKAGRMTAEGLREFRKATEDAIRQNRMERTSAYRSILSEMAKLITESVTKAGQFRDAEKERVEKIHHYANSDMQGMDAAEHVNNDQRLTNNPILRFFLKPLGTMDQMLRQMGSKHVNGEGYLWNHFMRGWLEATEKEYLGVSAAHKALDAKAKEVFGVKRWSDIFSIVRSLPSMHVKFWDGGKMRDHVLTQGNLLYIYMVNKMSDGKMKLRRMGIEEEQVRQMSMFMDPRLIEVGEWLQNEFLPGLRDKYNALHEKMFGAPMAAIDSYFPIKVLANARTREVDVATPEAEAKASTITGAIIKRTKNSLALDVLGSDALDVVLGHIQEMEHWAAFAEWNRDLNTLLSYKKFRNRVQNMSGLYGSGSTAWKNFRDACEVAAGVYKPASSGDAIDKTALNLAKGVTAGKISFRVFTAIKQLLSMPAFVSDASMMELGKSVATPWKSWNWAMKELPLFQKRWLSRQAGDSRLIATESDWKLWKTNFVEAASRYGMAPNAFVDALTVSIGAKAIYETKLAKYIENGYSVDAAEKKAKQDATILFNESQQSNEGAFLSAMQVDRSWVSVALTVFRNSSMGYQRMLVDALRNIKHRISKGYKDESIEFMAKQMVRDGLSEGQAQRAAERMYNRGFWHSMMRVGTFGFLVQFAWNLGAYLPYLVLGADDDEKEKMLKDASTHALLGGFVEGLSAGSLISEASNLIASGEGLKDYDPNLMPVVSDIKRLVQLWGTDEVAAANETLNLLGQMAIGVNPQTLTDIGVAIYDACDGDPQTAREATLLLARILQVPQSQTEQIFIDEIDFTVDKALDLTIEEFAQRYARYKRLRNTPLAVWMYSDEGERKVEDRYIKRFTKRAEELKRTRGNETAKAWYDYVDNEYKEIDLTIRELRSGAEKAAKKEDRVSVEEFAAKMQELMQTPEFGRYQQRAGKVKAVERLRQAMKDYPTKRDTLEDRMLEIRKQLVEEMQLAE